jgi:tricorn protease
MIRVAVVLVSLLSTLPLWAGQQDPILARKPALSREFIVFNHAGDLWRTSRDGGDAVRLTSGAGNETDPAFSPDGSMVAFTGEYDGNVDVYVVPVSGGVPKRLTYHPAPDRVLGWAPDGKRILFVSNRNSFTFAGRLFTIGLDETLPAELPLPTAEEGSYSADASSIAYVPLGRAFNTWKRYRGGRATPIWIARLSDSSILKVPRKDSNDFNPMWVGDRIYFLSDRNGPVTLFSYDSASRNVEQLIANQGLDIKSASVGPGAIVYEQFGSLNLFDLKTRKPRKIDLRLAADLPEVRPRWDKVATRISGYAISPTGARAAFEARGEIFTAPAEKGNIRNLTQTPGAAERDPSWSADGKWIAFFSDESGENQLHVVTQDGREKRRLTIGKHGFFYTPAWSPDSKKIAYTDNALNVCVVDLEQEKPVTVDTDTMDGPRRTRDLAWSPDSRWLAYTKQLSNTLRAVFVYSLETRKSFQVTDGMSDAYLPEFDKSGKYLFFAASTDFGLNVGWRDMSSMQRPVTRTIYALVLRKDLPSLIAPESDEEKDAAQASDTSKEKKPDKAPPIVKIDPDMIEQRIIALPIPPRDYRSIVGGKEGVLFLEESAFNPAGGFSLARTVHKFDLKTRKTDKLLDNVTAFAVSVNGEKMLFRQGLPQPPPGSGQPPATWTIASTAQPAKPGEGVLKLDDMEAWVEPRTEWKQMYNEAWRIERDFFYDPNLHGLDLDAVRKSYEPYLAGVGNRDDLNYLFAEMLGELTVSHLAIVGGSRAVEPKRVPGGLLGADYAHENGRWRITRVYTGESWNPQLRAPLTQPGVNVVAGEYILAINGRDLRSADSLYSRLEGLANKQVPLRVGSDPGGANSREVTVTPVENEFPLRHLAWVEGNRRKVTQLSGGRLAYVYLPDTANGGYVNFNRYYFSQVGKDGVVVDERFNGGGLQADYIIDYLSRRLMAFRVMRHGLDVPSPLAAIFGPKAMIVNEYAGSGGDALPFYFRKAGLGPIIGKRTWGGLVGGLGGYPALMDGGFVAAPAVGFYNAGGSWEVENFGITPDIEVEQDPKAVREGRDPQLEKAVEVLMEQLRRNPPKKYERPAFPNYHSSQTSTQ